MSKIKVIIKRPDEEYGHMCYVSNSISNLQRTVGGYVECLTLPAKTGTINILCNEDGKRLNLERNLKTPAGFLVGDIVVCKVGEEDFEAIPIDFAEWKDLVKKWQQ